MRKLLILIFAVLPYFLSAQSQASLLLNGCDNCVEVSESGSLFQDIDQLTIESWIFPNCENQNLIIIGKQWCLNEFSFYLSANEGKLFWNVSDDGICNFPNILQSKEKVLEPGVFTHVALVYTQNDTKMFINGIEVETEWVQGGQTSIYPSMEPFRIGCFKGITGNKSNFFSGLINNLRVWDKALTPNEINFNKSNSLTGNENNLVLNYEMQMNGTFGPDIRVENKVTNYPNLTGIAYVNSASMPKFILSDEYLNFTIDLGKDTATCDQATLELNIDVEPVKEIIWKNGSKSNTYLVESSGLHWVQVETEQCRFFNDTIEVNLNKSTSTVINYSLCTNDSISVNDIIYKEAGTYTQNFLNASGCDSTLVISIEVNDLTEGNVEYKLCDGESVLVNDILYSDAGTFQQTLKNAGGCDSLLTIQIIKGLSTSSSHIFSLCNQSTVVFNGITYTTAGVFEQVIPNNSGCDSTLYITVLPCTVNATYDFQQCNALTPENSMTYNEFLPTYRSPISCGEVILTNVFRENPQDQKHSCSAGQASSLSMCVGASSSCTFEEADQEPVTFRFEAKPTEGSSIRFNHLEFYHLSPSQFSWIQGASGANNYPSRFALTVYINDIVVFQRTDLSTGNQWTKEKFDFFEDDKFTLQTGDSVIIELTPYCQTANGGNVSVWDVDNIGLFFSCKDTDNRQVGGRIAGSELAAMDVVVQRKTGDRILQQISNNGSFLFTKNDPFTSYEFKAYNDENAAANISTLDLVLIQKHILQVTPFENPLQFVAADVNKDGKVNTIDLVELRKIILGIQERFSHNTSWRMIPVKNMDVQQHPLLWEDTYYLLPGYHHMMDLDFVPVKIGDIDGAKDFNLFVKPPQTTKN